jgi:hypothetical protein
VPQSCQRQPDVPLLVWESGDLSAYGSVAEAESALEPTDVANGIDRGFDASGRLLNLGIQPYEERIFGIIRIAREHVTIALGEDVPTHRQELADSLVHFLAATGVGPALTSRLSHEELVAEAVRVVSASKH